MNVKIYGLPFSKYFGCQRLETSLWSLATQSTHSHTDHPFRRLVIEDHMAIDQPTTMNKRKKVRNSSRPKTDNHVSELSS